MRHFASPAFWEAYQKLPDPIRVLADKNYTLLKADPHHPSLQLKKVGRFWSVRVGLRYRALAVEVEEGLLWFWIAPTRTTTTSLGDQSLRNGGAQPAAAWPSSSSGRSKVSASS